MRHGEGFTAFWRQMLTTRERRLLFVLGHGFDPRMCEAIRTILTMDVPVRCDCLMLEYKIGTIFPLPGYKERVLKNLEELRRLLGDVGGTLRTRDVEVWSEGGAKIASVSAARVFTSINEVSDYTDVLIDISAMPQGIYFPLVRKLLRLFDGAHREQPQLSLPNIHVVVAENPAIDDKIADEGLAESATFLHNFDASDRESEEQKPKIWIPVLGEGQGDQLQKIRVFVRPDEVCPVLPFPSYDPRRGDNLIREYQRFLFDDLIVDPRNFIYADERNPFQVYRQIRKAALQYDEAFGILHGCKMVLSALSSKLLSVGTLLAAYDLKSSEEKSVGVAHVEPMGYQLKDGIEEVTERRPSELFELWLAGECYEQ